MAARPSRISCSGIGTAEFSQRMIEGMPGETHARACLLDHAAALHSALDPAQDRGVSIVVSDAALAGAAAVWRDVDHSDASWSYARGCQTGAFKPARCAQRLAGSGRRFVSVAMSERLAIFANLGGGSN